LFTFTVHSWNYCSNPSVDDDIVTTAETSWRSEDYRDCHTPPSPRVAICNSAWALDGSLDKQWGTAFLRLLQKKETSKVQWYCPYFMASATSQSGLYRIALVWQLTWNQMLKSTWCPIKLAKCISIKQKYSLLIKHPTLLGGKFRLPFSPLKQQSIHDYNSSAS